MRNFTRMLSTVAFGVLAATGAQAQSTGTMTVSGTSTVRAWTCSTTSFEVKTLPVSAFAAKVLAGEKGIDGVTAKIPVAALDCKNGTMNDHMRNALKAKANPAILFELNSYDIEKAAAGVIVQARGRLTMAGMAQPIEMKVTVTEAPGGKIRVRGEREFLLTSFGMKPPSFMLGTMKVGDKVKITYDLVL